MLPGFIYHSWWKHYQEGKQWISYLTAAFKYWRGKQKTLLFPLSLGITSIEVDDVPQIAGPQLCPSNTIPPELPPLLLRSSYCLSLALSSLWISFHLSCCSEGKFWSKWVRDLINPAFTLFCYTLWFLTTLITLWGCTLTGKSTSNRLWWSTFWFPLDGMNLSFTDCRL